MIRNKQGIARVMEFVVVFGVFLLVLSVFYNAIQHLCKPRVVEYTQEDLEELAEVLVSNPGRWKKDTSNNTDWENRVRELNNNNANLTGFVLRLNEDNITINHNNKSSYGVLSLNKIKNATALSQEVYNDIRKLLTPFYYFNLSFYNIFYDNSTHRWKRAAEPNVTFGPKLLGVVYWWEWVVSIYDDNYQGQAILRVSISTKRRKWVLRDTVNDPNGGEVWTGGSDKWVDFSVSGGTPPYTLYINYSTDGGTTWTNHNKTTVDPAGTYNWTLTLWSVDSAQCRVNITANDTSTRAWDISDANFEIDSTAPEITAHDPANQTIDVPATTNVVVNFSEGMNTAATESAFGLYEAGSTTKVSGTFSWNATNEQLTFDPTDALATSTKYYINITTDAKDDSSPSNSLPSSNSTWFETW